MRQFIFGCGHSCFLRPVGDGFARLREAFANAAGSCAEFFPVEIGGACRPRQYTTLFPLIALLTMLVFGALPALAEGGDGGGGSGGGGGAGGSSGGSSGGASGGGSGAAGGGHGAVGEGEGGGHTSSANSPGASTASSGSSNASAGPANAIGAAALGFARTLFPPARPTPHGRASDASLARQAEALGEAKTLSEILPLLNRVAPGRVLRVAFDKTHDGYVYNFTVLSDQGRYMDVSLDAASGSLLYARSR